MVLTVKGVEVKNYHVDGQMYIPTRIYLFCCNIDNQFYKGRLLRCWFSKEQAEKTIRQYLLKEVEVNYIEVRKIA